MLPLNIVNSLDALSCYQGIGYWRYGDIIGDIEIFLFSLN